jgi:RNA polymerase sigma-70 factor (sigma-E family)
VRDVAWTAYAEVVTAHQDKLFRLAMLLSGDRATAEDLVSDTLVALHRPWTEGRIEDFGKYARRAINNRYLSGLRSNERAQRFAPRLVALDVAPDEMNQQVDRQPILAALTRLSPRQRAVVVARYYIELSVAETADMLGISRGTVKSTTSDALSKLRTILEDGSRA